MDKSWLCGRGVQDEGRKLDWKQKLPFCVENLLTKLHPNYWFLSITLPFSLLSLTMFVKLSYHLYSSCYFASTPHAMRYNNLSGRDRQSGTLLKIKMAPYGYSHLAILWKARCLTFLCLYFLLYTMGLITACSYRVVMRIK